MSNYPNKIRARFGFGEGEGRYFDPWREATRTTSPWEGDQALGARVIDEAVSYSSQAPSPPPGTTIAEVEWQSGGQPWIVRVTLGEVPSNPDETTDELLDRLKQAVEQGLQDKPIDVQ